MTGDFNPWDSGERPTLLLELCRRRIMELVFGVLIRFDALGFNIDDQMCRTPLFRASEMSQPFFELSISRFFLLISGIPKSESSYRLLLSRLPSS